MATRSPISSQCAIIASWTALTLVGVDHAALVGGHQVGDAKHRHGVDGLEAGKARAVGRVANVLIGRNARGHGGAAALKRNLARGGDLFQCAGGPDLLELDQLRSRLDGRDDVVLALAAGDVVVLFTIFAARDDQLERVFTGLRGLGDFDLDVVAGLATVEGKDAITGKRLVFRAGQLGLSRGSVAVGADPDDVAGAAAVEEVAVNGVREVRSLEESAERLRVLAPVGDKRRLVDRAFLGQAYERRRRGPDAFNRTRSGFDLLDVNTGRQVIGHGRFILLVDCRQVLAERRIGRVFEQETSGPVKG